VRPLDGVRVVVTRAAHQAEELARPFRELGAEVILLPAIGIAPAADLDKLRRAARNCNRYHWIIFTSANAVAAFVAELPFAARNCKSRIAAIGASTRAAAEERGFQVSIMPEKYVAESLVASFAAENLQGRRILIPTAAVTRDVVATELRKRGAQVDVVEAYRNILPPETEERARVVFRDPYPDWVTFASSSAVDNLAALIGTEPLSRVKIATLGPITSATVRKHGLVVAAEAREQSVEALVQAVASCKTGP
jgi:uroporphyrinogen-III synthase